MSNPVPSITRVAAALLLLLGLAACNGPTGLMAGGSLDGSGTTSETPSDWAFAGDSGLCQLETDPQEPYSVNLAYTVMGGRLFVNAGGTETRWARNIAADPRVRLVLDGRLYELRADRVVDRLQIEAFAEAWTGQSFFRRDPRDYEEVWIFELTKR